MTWPQSLPLQPCFSVSAMSPPWTADTSYSPCHTNMAWAIWHESYHMLSIFALALRQQSERSTLTRPWRSPRNAMPTEIHGCKPDQSGQFQMKCKWNVWVRNALAVTSQGLIWSFLVFCGTRRTSRPFFLSYTIKENVKKDEKKRNSTPLHELISKVSKL